MGQYLSPGVYVEEVPPLARPIAGVGTSTPGFIGVIQKNTIKLLSPPPSKETTSPRWVEYNLPSVENEPRRISSWSEYVKYFGGFIGGSTVPNAIKVVKEPEGTSLTTYVTGVTDANLTVMASWASNSKNNTGIAESNGNFKILIDNGTEDVIVTTTLSGKNYNVDDGQRYLAHAVYGFFNNGGSSCYVSRIASEDKLQDALNKFAAIDEITMVAAPGFSTIAAYTKLINHCELLKDRVAILDSVAEVPDLSKLQKVLAPPETVGAPPETVGRPQDTTYAAFYFPWLQVFDPGQSLIDAAPDAKPNPAGPGYLYVPPSGHIAGVYARNDNTRGVFKAPANEALMGVTGLKYTLSKADQDGLNGVGVNLIRPLVGAFRVWGARTVGGDANGEYRYISTRRYFNYLRESIDQGTQFVVFEPNSPALWERIKRSVGGFLLNEWRAGALFGTTPDKAFFVKCDADTNPPDVREAGQVVTEIGVAIVKPAEFVIFRIQQTTGN